jgi:Holliday junction resolvase RusA-like endonuclease
VSELRRVSFVLLGSPVPKARARVMKGYSYTPKPTRDAEAAVRTAALAHRAGWKSERPIRLVCRFFRGDARGCDIDNLTKLVQDALNHVTYRDDKQIVVLSVLKAIDRARPRTEVEIEELLESGEQLPLEVRSA